MPWVFNPHSGGLPIPAAVREETRRRILAHAEKRYKGRYLSMDVRFRGVFCYIDSFVEPDISPNWPPKNWPETREEMRPRLLRTPLHLCRLRYFARDSWSLDFFTYSNEKYTPCAFGSGEFFGTPEEALDIGAGYLPNPPKNRKNK